MSFYGTGSKLGHNILGVVDYVLYSILKLSTSICLKLRFIIPRTDIA